MEAGIRGISGHASQAFTVASQAVELVRSTDGSINKIASQIDGLQSSISESVRVQSDTAHHITTLEGNAIGDNKNVIPYRLR